MKIKIDIPCFGEKYISSNTKCIITPIGLSYIIFKKGTNIHHNEYGPSYEHKGGSYEYRVNNKYHRLTGCAFKYSTKCPIYYVFGKHIGTTKKQLIKKLANILIPKK